LFRSQAACCAAGGMVWKNQGIPAGVLSSARAKVDVLKTVPRTSKAKLKRFMAFLRWLKVVAIFLAALTSLRPDSALPAEFGSAESWIRTKIGVPAKEQSNEGGPIA
jgi:hypothetical protein